MILNEGLCYEVMLDEYARYIAENSSNVRELAEKFKFNMTESDVRLDMRNKTLDITDGPDTLKCFIEDNMKNELDNLFKGFDF